MMAYTMKFAGLDELQRGLIKRSHLEAAKTAVAKNGSRLQAKIQENANFKKGYQTGTTKRSVGLILTDSGLTAKSGATTHYAEYLENGTRFMEAQPFVRPAFNVVKGQFNSDLRKLVR